jgi:mannosyltransferase OCH1-like enzyme
MAVGTPVIPRILHQTWKTTDIPDEWQACVESWKTLHPQWQYKLWTDDTGRWFIQNHYPDFLNIYDAFSYNIQRADAIRYCLLHAFGGVYVDLDMECLQPLEPLLSGHAFVAGYEPPLHAQMLKQEKMLCNAFMASVPGHRLLTAILQSLKSCNPKITVHTEVLETTGPLMLTRVVQQYPDHDITLLPDHLLYPLSNDPTILALITQDPGQRRSFTADCLERGAYALHYWANSWMRDLAGTLHNQNPFDVPGFTFFPGEDSGGCDSFNAGRNIPETAVACTSHPDAWGFNTDGFVKYHILPRSRWTVMENRHGNQGLYVKNSHIHLCLKKQRIILFYNTMWNQPLDYPEAEIPAGYMLSSDQRLLPEAAAVVYHIPSLRLTKPLRKWPGQLWVAWSMECEANYPSLFSSPGFLKFFDLLMTYHLDADVVLPYVLYEFGEALRKPAPAGRGRRLVNAFISSNVNASGRVEYLRDLMTCLEVDSYGKILHNSDVMPDRGRQSKLDTQAHYRFSLAFENAIARDYVTEKFYDPLLAGSVPVYLGAPNIEDFAPGDHCFINTANFPDPRSLADYLLALSRDESAYQNYFAWKEKPFRPAFGRLLELQREHAFVRMVRAIEKRLTAPNSLP